MARDDRKYDDEYEDDEEYEDDDYYESDEDYPRRNPLKPFVIALIILMVLMAVIIGLLFMRLQTANDRRQNQLLMENGGSRLTGVTRAQGIRTLSQEEGGPTGYMPDTS